MSRGYNGRDLLVKIGGTLVAAVQSKTITKAREAVDVTTDDSDGNRTLLAEPGVRSTDIQVEGVATSSNFSDLLSKFEANTLLQVSAIGPDGSAQIGDFFLSNLTQTGEHDGAVTFSATFQSSGMVSSSEAS